MPETARAQRTYISVADTAKELRKSLKEAFPSIKFSVRSKSYSGGASIRVGWTDGPTTPMVEKVSKHFQSASFNGMDDSTTYHDAIRHGKLVHWGADYVSSSRTISKDLLSHAAARVAKRFGIEDMPPIIVNQWGSAQLDQTHPMTFTRLAEWARYDVNDLVHQESYRLYQYNGSIYRVAD